MLIKLVLALRLERRACADLKLVTTSRPQFPHLYIKGTGLDWINANILFILKFYYSAIVYTLSACCVPSTVLSAVGKRKGGICAPSPQEAIIYMRRGH